MRVAGVKYSAGSNTGQPLSASTAPCRLNHFVFTEPMASIRICPFSRHSDTPKLADDLFSLLGIEEKDLRQTNVPSAQPPAVDAVPPPPVTPPPAPELGPPAPIKAIQPPVPASSPEPLAAAPAPEAVQDQASEVLKAAKEAPKAASDAMEGLSSAAAESITQVGRRG